MKAFIERESCGGGVIGSNLHSVAGTYRSPLIFSGKQEYIHISLLKKILGQSDLSSMRTSLRKKFTVIYHQNPY